MTRKKLGDVMMLESVIRFIADNIGNILSTKRIADIMTADGRKIDQKTVEKYLSSLCETFFVYEAKRYNIKGKQLLKTLGKYYLVDVGLLRRLAQLAPTAFGEGNRLFTEFKGALTENYVLQSLTNQFEVVPRYWTQTNPPYEVDFLIQRENDIFPVEVKSDTNTTSKSLKKFKELFPDKVKLRVRFSLDNLKLDDDVLNIPLFMADEADRLIGLALEQRNIGISE